MNYIGFIIMFCVTILTFHINHRIQKMTTIKIIINSLFDIYSNETVFEEFELEEIPIRLMDEIIAIEKLNDNNFYITLEVQKLKKLRLVFFNFNTKDEALKQIDEIKFKSLDRSFILLCFFNIKIPYIHN